MSASISNAARVDGTDPDERIAALREVARNTRVSVLHMIGAAGMGHVGGDFSVTDILTTLLFDTLKIDPTAPQSPDRDRLILSKGHCSASLYSLLARRGFFPIEQLDRFMAPLSPLNGHPNRLKIPGVEANTGPLGHGLPIGVGCALASRLSRASWRTFVVLGDGELQEGSNWEAAMTAGHHGLESLTAVVDRNGLQQGAPTEQTNRLESLAEKWRAFGWDVVDVDGHDHAELIDAFDAQPSGRPRCVVARTVKGKGVSFMEGQVVWHHKVPDTGEIRRAIAELQ